MSNNPFNKKPAFFPFVSAEIFFEAESNPAKIESDVDMDAALDELLNSSEESKAEVVVAA